MTNNIIDVAGEVEAVLGRAMTDCERRKFRELRRCGYANPIDIARQLEAA